ncbi:MAG: flagellar hook-length control protein FliK [Myxococcota bacterium]|nr:flagellar hook-length control protein FliK [Myxococcota bacterium]
MSFSVIEAALIEDLPLPAEVVEGEAGAEGAVFEQALDGALEEETERQSQESEGDASVAPEPAELPEEARPLRLALGFAPAREGESAPSEPPPQSEARTAPARLPLRAPGALEAPAPETTTEAARVEGDATANAVDAARTAPAPSAPTGGELVEEAISGQDTETARAALEGQAASRVVRSDDGAAREPSPAPGRVPDPRAAQDAADAGGDAAPRAPVARSAPVPDAALQGLPGATSPALTADRPERAAAPADAPRAADAARFTEAPPPPADTAAQRPVQAAELARPELILPREVEPPIVPPTPASSETAATAPSALASAPRPTPADALPVHVEWLAERGGGSARIDLHPPHLGRVEISVRVRGTDVEVAIAAPESAAQVVVNGQRDTLAEALGARELRLTHFEVGSGARDQAGADGQGRDPETGFQRGDARPGGERSPFSPDPGPPGAARMQRASLRLRSSDRVDLHV